MLNVLLVDDELLSRSMLRGLIDWEDNGYHICGECSDGKVAIRYLQEMRVDIVITDIKMTHINGDELVAYLHQHCPKTAAIVLSGYQDFQYVRDTLQNGAVDYITKGNLDSKTLLKTLKAAREVLRIGPEIKKSVNNLEALQRQFLLQLAAGFFGNSVHDIQNNLDMLGIILPMQNAMAIIMVAREMLDAKPEATLQGELLTQISICNIVNEILLSEVHGAACHIGNDRFLLAVALGSQASEAKMDQEISMLLRRISFCLNKYIGIDASFCVGKRESLTAFSESYASAEKLVAELFCEGSNAVLYAEKHADAPPRSPDDLHLKAEEAEALDSAVDSGESDRIQKTLEAAFDRLTSVARTRQDCLPFFTDLNILFVRICVEKGLEKPNPDSGNMNFFEQIMLQSSIEQCCNYAKGVFCTLVETIAHCGIEKRYSHYVQDAINYLREHYQEPISLTQIADELTVSAAYLSSIFKAEVGIPFSDYLSGIRLNRCLRLMYQGETSLKKIAKQSGFQNYSYFFTLFKNKTGFTPRQYIQFQLFRRKETL